MSEPRLSALQALLCCAPEPGQSVAAAILAALCSTLPLVSVEPHAAAARVAHDSASLWVNAGEVPSPAQLSQLCWGVVQALMGLLLGLCCGTRGTTSTIKLAVENAVIVSPTGGAKQCDGGDCADAAADSARWLCHEEYDAEAETTQTLRGAAAAVAASASVYAASAPPTASPVGSSTDPAEQHIIKDKQPHIGQHDRRALGGAVELIILWGVYPRLQPGVGAPPSHRVRPTSALGKLVSPDRVEDIDLAQGSEAEKEKEDNNASSSGCERGGTRGSGTCGSGSGGGVGMGLATAAAAAAAARVKMSAPPNAPPAAVAEKMREAALSVVYRKPGLAAAQATTTTQGDHSVGGKGMAANNGSSSSSGGSSSSGASLSETALCRTTELQDCISVLCRTGLSTAVVEQQQQQQQQHASSSSSSPSTQVGAGIATYSAAEVVGQVVRDTMMPDVISGLLQLSRVCRPRPICQPFSSADGAALGSSWEVAVCELLGITSQFPSASASAPAAAAAPMVVAASTSLPLPLPPATDDVTARPPALSRISLEEAFLSLRMINQPPCQQQRKQPTAAAAAQKTKKNTPQPAKQPLWLTKMVGRLMSRCVMRSGGVEMTLAQLGTDPQGSNSRAFVATVTHLGTPPGSTVATPSEYCAAVCPQLLSMMRKGCGLPPPPPPQAPPPQEGYSTFNPGAAAGSRGPAADNNKNSSWSSARKENASKWTAAMADAAARISGVLLASTMSVERAATAAAAVAAAAADADTTEAADVTKKKKTETEAAGGGGGNTNNTAFALARSVNGSGLAVVDNMLGDLLRPLRVYGGKLATATAATAAQAQSSTGRAGLGGSSSGSRQQQQQQREEEKDEVQLDAVCVTEADVTASLRLLDMLLTGNTLMAMSAGVGGGGSSSSGVKSDGVRKTGPTRLTPLACLLRLLRPELPALWDLHCFACHSRSGVASVTKSLVNTAVKMMEGEQTGTGTGTTDRPDTAAGGGQAAENADKGSSSSSSSSSGRGGGPLPVLLEMALGRSMGQEDSWLGGCSGGDSSSSSSKHRSTPAASAALSWRSEQSRARRQREQQGVYLGRGSDGGIELRLSRQCAHGHGQQQQHRLQSLPGQRRHWTAELEASLLVDLVRTGLGAASFNSAGLPGDLFVFLLSEFFRVKQRDREIGLEGGGGGGGVGGGDGGGDDGDGGSSGGGDNGLWIRELSPLESSVSSEEAARLREVCLHTLAVLCDRCGPEIVRKGTQVLRTALTTLTYLVDGLELDEEQMRRSEAAAHPLQFVGGRRQGDAKGNHGAAGGGRQGSLIETLSSQPASDGGKDDDDDDDTSIEIGGGGGGGGGMGSAEAMHADVKAALGSDDKDGPRIAKLGLAKDGSAESKGDARGGDGDDGKNEEEEEEEEVSKMAMIQLALQIISNLLAGGGGEVKLQGGEDEALLWQLIQPLSTLARHPKCGADVSELASTLQLQIAGLQSDAAKRRAAGKGGSAAKSSKPDVSLRDILKDLQDPVVPVRAYALMTLKQMVEKRDPAVAGHSASLYGVFRARLADPESYIHLSATHGLQAIATADPGEFLPRLVRDAFAFPSSVPAGGASKEDAAGSDLELRLRTGDVLVAVVQFLGDLAPHHANTLLGPGLAACAKDPEPHVRACALTVLAELCRTANASPAVHACRVELLEASTAIARASGSEPPLVRRGALHLLTLMLRGFGRVMLHESPVLMKEAYHQLKVAQADDPDELCQHHAGLGLGEIAGIMTEFANPVATNTLHVGIGLDRIR